MFTKTSGGLSSFLADMHPAVKLVVFLAAIHSAASSSALYSYAFFTLLACLSVFLSGIKPLELLKRMRPFLLILATTFLINLAFKSGLKLSAMLTYRFFLIIVFSMVLTVSTDTKALVSVLLSPFRGEHGSNLRTVFMVALEFIPVFISEVKSATAEIKKMPEYEKNAFGAIFRPELYLNPVMHGLAGRSSAVAEDVSNGTYAAVPLTMPKIWELALGALTLAAAVGYAVQ